MQDTTLNNSKHSQEHRLQIQEGGIRTGGKLKGVSHQLTPGSVWTFRGDFKVVLVISILAELPPTPKIGTFRL